MWHKSEIFKILFDLERISLVLLLSVSLKVSLKLIIWILPTRKDLALFSLKIQWSSLYLMALFLYLKYFFLILVEIFNFNFKLQF